jgi:hypothetical protein
MTAFFYGALLNSAPLLSRIVNNILLLNNALDIQYVYFCASNQTKYSL